MYPDKNNMNESDKDEAERVVSGPSAPGSKPYTNVPPSPTITAINGRSIIELMVLLFLIASVLLPGGLRMCQIYNAIQAVIIIKLYILAVNSV